VARDSGHAHRGQPAQLHTHIKVAATGATGNGASDPAQPAPAAIGAGVPFGSDDAVASRTGALLASQRRSRDRPVTIMMTLQRCGARGLPASTGVWLSGTRCPAACTVKPGHCRVAQSFDFATMQA